MDRTEVLSDDRDNNSGYLQRPTCNSTLQGVAARLCHDNIGAGHTGGMKMSSDARRSLVVVLALALGTGTMRASAANSDEQYPSNLEQKLGAGLVNTATGWMELVKSPVAITKKGGIGWGMTLGPVMGVVNTVGRTASGVFDLITFVLPTKPLVDPPMIWQDFYRETTYSQQFEVYDH